MHRVRLPVASLATAVVLACGDGGTQPGPGPGSGPVATTSVSVIDNSFSPPANSVTVGQTVTWTWNGNNPHNVTFDDASVGNSTTKTGGGFTRTFGQAGEFTYICTVHGRAVMSGKVVVEN